MCKRRYNIKAIISDKRGRILSIGQNSYVKSHPVMLRLSSKVGQPYKIFLHAEIAAIVKCRELDKAYSICVFKTDKTGGTTTLQPCPICMSAIQTTGIKKINGNIFK